MFGPGFIRHRNNVAALRGLIESGKVAAEDVAIELEAVGALDPETWSDWDDADADALDDYVSELVNG